MEIKTAKEISDIVYRLEECERITDEVTYFFMTNEFEDSCCSDIISDTITRLQLRKKEIEDEIKDFKIPQE